MRKGEEHSPSPSPPFLCLALEKVSFWKVVFVPRLGKGEGGGWESVSVRPSAMGA